MDRLEPPLVGGGDVQDAGAEAPAFLPHGLGGGPGPGDAGGRRAPSGTGGGTPATDEEPGSARRAYRGKTRNRIGPSARKPRSWVPWPTSKASVASRRPACRATSFNTRYSTRSPERRLANG